MPIDWVAPALFFVHNRNGIPWPIYHIYKDDSIQSGPRLYHYGLSILAQENDEDGDNGAFDVRSLPGWRNVNPATADEFERIKTTIRTAIDAGYFDTWGNASGDPFPEALPEPSAPITAVPNTPTTITLPIAEIVVALTPGPHGTTGTISPRLHADADGDDGYTGAVDGLESLILAMACAGVIITTTPMLDAIATAIDAIANEYE